MKQNERNRTNPLNDRLDNIEAKLDALADLVIGDPLPTGVDAIREAHDGGTTVFEITPEVDAIVRGLTIDAIDDLLDHGRDQYLRARRHGGAADAIRAGAYLDALLDLRSHVFRGGR